MLRPAVVLVATLCLSSLHLSAQSTPAVAPLQAPDAAAVRDRLDAYLLAYEPQLSELIADQLMLMEQHDVPEREGRPGAETFTKRTLRSEVAFLALPGGAGWLGFRRVRPIDRQAVAESSDSLVEALPSGAQSDCARARTMLADSARHHLGEPRTTNLPTLPLEMLHPRNAKRFSGRIVSKERIRGKDTTLMAFVETLAPTIITATDGSSMRSIVRASVETADGRPWKAEVITRDTRDNAFPLDAIVSLTFKQHDSLGLLVPATMHEEFFAGVGRRAWSDAT